MASLKQELKQIFIQRQHKRYEKELRAKNLSYDRWIRQQEEKLNIPAIKEYREKRLINELRATAYEGNKSKKAEQNAEKGEIFHFIGIVDENGQYFDGKMTVIQVPVGLLFGHWKTILEPCDAEIVLISMYDGEISQICLPMICHEFYRNRNVEFIYGDEDTLQRIKGREENPVRVQPWFKPDWSPDRFLSCFYFGGLVAVRAETLRKALQREKKRNSAVGAEPEVWFYKLLFEMLKDAKAFTTGHESEQLPVCHIRQVLFHNTKNGYEQIKRLQLWENVQEKLQEDDRKVIYREENRPLLSVIIPSKDNLEALFHCLDSLFEKTVAKYPFEIVLVDNGSSEENREKIFQKVHKLNGQEAYLINERCAAAFRGCRYFYEVMPFNFSGMCNLGAEKAKGELYLFLNDDMEIVQSDWMDRMAEKALLPYAGAVGVKLLYPDSQTIQHAGITNLRVGPAHKLQFLSDASEHYFGMNRGVHNMLAVTGACLMVRRDVFWEAGGFNEKLAVAFNDVDLCYTIFEKGYYNIERNDVILYHHESLSRGNDGDSPEKQLRLLKEKDILYERHQEIYGKDFFYHPYLATDMLEREYSPAYRYQVTLDMPWSEVVQDAKGVRKAREDKCLVVGMECAMDIYKWQYGVSPEKRKMKPRPEEMGYYFQGYSFVIGADNACYKKKLLLKNRTNGEIWTLPVDDRYRQDIKNNLKDQENVDLTGFAAKMRQNAVPTGVYQFGMLAEDMCSRQKLINWSNWVLEVTADGKEWG